MNMQNADMEFLKQNEKVETITPSEAGKIIGRNAETIRAGLRAKVFDFGVAIPPRIPGGNWSYIIIKSKFLQWAGINKFEGECA